MQYRPDTKKNIDRFIIGKVVEEIVLKKNISPSVLVFDRKIIIEIIKNIPDYNGEKSDELEYNSLSYITLEPKKTYLFAVANEFCIGFTEVLGNQVLLPDGSSMLLEEFIRNHFGATFPDYYGFES